MTTGYPLRDGEIEAFVVDRYLDALLTRAPLGPAGAGVATTPGVGPATMSADFPADLRATAERLVRDLPRYHPSFRFEEELAARLAAAAASLSGGAPRGTLIAFPAPVAGDLSVDDRPPGVRPVVLGGVLTSAALSIAGAAWVAWRRNRGPADPMTRAARRSSRPGTCWLWSSAPGDWGTSISRAMWPSSALTSPNTRSVQAVPIQFPATGQTGW